MEEDRFLVFSDESGSWHDDNDLYVRSWVVIGEKEYNQNLKVKIDSICELMNSSKELKWSSFANSRTFFDFFKEINYRIFITITNPSDIKWESKYLLTKNFEENINNFNFGSLGEDIKSELKNKIYRDIKNTLFLNYYEKLHIKNAQKGISSVIVGDGEYELSYLIDPPQMSQSDWKGILKNISDNQYYDISFKDSKKSQGIQFADIIAGAVRSYVIEDKKSNRAGLFLKEIKSKLISMSKENPNPNLIMFSETNDKTIKRSGDIWKI